MQITTTNNTLMKYFCCHKGKTRHAFALIVQRFHKKRSWFVAEIDSPVGVEIVKKTLLFKGHKKNKEKKDPLLQKKIISRQKSEITTQH